MTGAAEILRDSASVVVIDWPSREVPEALVMAGLTVFVKGGPGPGDYSTWEIGGDGAAAARKLARPPEQADLVYFHRPFSELPSVIHLAQALGARALWRQSGLTPDGARSPAGCWVTEDESQQGRALAVAAGLAYVDNVYIADAVRSSQ